MPTPFLYSLPCIYYVSLCIALCLLCFSIHLNLAPCRRGGRSRSKTFSGGDPPGNAARYVRQHEGCRARKLEVRGILPRRVVVSFCQVGGWRVALLTERERCLSGPGYWKYWNGIIQNPIEVFQKQSGHENQFTQVTS